MLTLEGGEGNAKARGHESCSGREFGVGVRLGVGTQWTEARLPLGSHQDWAEREEVFWVAN